MISNIKEQELGAHLFPEINWPIMYLIPATLQYLGGCRTGSYVHYPTITTEMLDKVRTRKADYNNRGAIAR